MKCTWRVLIAITLHMTGPISTSIGNLSRFWGPTMMAAEKYAPRLRPTHWLYSTVGVFEVNDSNGHPIMNHHPVLTINHYVSNTPKTPPPPHSPDRAFTLHCRPYVTASFVTSAPRPSSPELLTAIGLTLRTSSSGTDE